MIQKEWVDTPGSAFWGGLVIGYGGVSVTLASAFRYAEEQGLPWSSEVIGFHARGCR